LDISFLLPLFLRFFFVSYLVPLGLNSTFFLAAFGLTFGDKAVPLLVQLLFLLVPGLYTFNGVLLLLEMLPGGLYQ
jgi:hypothetical protein